MSDPLQEQTVREFILENEGNIDIAVQVTRAFPTIQRQILQRTLDGLEKQLQSRSGKEWEIWNNRDEVLSKRYSGFSFRRATWGDVYVLLEIQREEENTVIGLWRDRQRMKIASLDAALTDAFAKLPGKANRWWAWYEAVPPDYGNWNAAPALAAMQFRQKEIVDYWAKQMLLVHKIASPVLDRFFAKK